MKNIAIPLKNKKKIAKIIVSTKTHEQLLRKRCLKQNDENHKQKTEKKQYVQRKHNKNL